MKNTNTIEGEVNILSKKPHAQLSVVSDEIQPKNPRNKQDGILLVIPTQIFSHEIPALINTSATRNFISLAGLTKCGLKGELHNTFLELGESTKVLSRGRAIDILVVTASYLQKTDLTVYSLLHEVDLALGITWLVEADPLISWSIGTIYLPDSILSFRRIMGEW